VNLEAVGLRVAYRGVPALDGVSFAAPAGRVTALIGPNGAGKSTVLRCLYGLVPYDGRIVLDGAEGLAASRLHRSRIAYLPQDLQIRSRLSALEIVLLGKLGTLGWHIPDADLRVARASLHAVGIAALAGRPVTELSIGQRQLVFVAQALVRDPSILLLDEPVSALDLRHQVELLDLIRRIVARNGATALVVLHDLNLTCRFTDEAVLLSNGRVYASGAPREVLTPEAIAAVYGVEANVHHHTDGGVHITPVRALPIGSA
jgi:iron complex transport system ATP-binding protein